MKATKAQVIASLREIASLLEYHGESVFKVRAYETAAQSLAAEPAPLEDLLAGKGRLTALRGIGKAIAEVIRETAEKGVSAYHLQLREDTPAGLFDLMQVPGLGTKKIRLLYSTLGIATVEDLEREAAAGTLATLPGFGKKTAEKILAGISQMRRFAGQALYHHALAAARPLLEGLRACPAVIRVEPAGSLRRGREVVRDIDFVASSDHPDEVMEAFVGLPGVAEVIARGSTKTSVRLDPGLQADLRVVPDPEYATALHHFTGSREHNIALRARAVSLGIRISEYGLFRDPAPAPEGTETDSGAGAAAATAEQARRSGQRIEVRDERELFAALGLDYIPPELREGMGEIEAAARHALPDLVEFADYRGVLHCHSTWSDGKDSIRDLALAARDQWGWEYIAICDHSEAAAYAGGVRRADLARQHAEIDELNEELARSGGRPFRILKGCECDIMPDGSLDYPDEYLLRMDVVVASVHSRFQMPEAEMTARLLKALEHPCTTILGHVSGRLLLGRDPYSFDLEAVLTRAGETGTAVEINCDPARMDLDWRFCRRAKELGVVFAVNPDAHSVAGLANVRYGIIAARKGWLGAGDILNCLGLDPFLNRVRAMREWKLRNL